MRSWEAKYGKDNPEHPFKILVTYDSFRHVKDALKHFYWDEGDHLGSYDDRFDEFQVVVDEFQSIMIDSRFKSDTEIELLDNLKGVQKVCFVSATPLLDKYLSRLDEFKDLPYYELDWETEDPGRVKKPKLEIRFITSSLNQAVNGVIQNYKGGRFETRINSKTGQFIESKEAVLFLNSVSGICQAIRTNKLHLEECNILCASTDANDEKVRKAFNDVLKKETEDLKVHPRIPKETPVIGKIPTKGQKHKMFTFCTRTVYLGADFYSECARTFIFSDSNIDCLSVDISMDLEQILGRQRLKENPWKNCAKMFVKTTNKKHKTTQEEFNQRLEEKKKKSENLLSVYLKSEGSETHDLAEAYQKLAKTFHYKDNYVAVNEHAGSDLVPVFNNLMMVSEMRSFEVQQVDYADRFTVFNAVGERQVEGINVEIQKNALKFNGMKSSMDKLKMIVKLSEDLGENDMSDFLSLITPERLKDYYTEMGPDRIKASGYREDKLKAEWAKAHQDELGVSDELILDIVEYFKLGQRYTNPDIKAKLKELYQKHGYEKTAKASDLEEYFWLKKVYMPSIKKNGFEIQKKR
jgi:hypothetical protein